MLAPLAMLRGTWVVLASSAIALAASGCFVLVDNDDRVRGSGGSGGSEPQPIGPLAGNAEEAWPNKPELAPLSAEQIARACVAEARCGKLADPSQNALLAVSFCVSQVIWSAERAIPLSNLLHFEERAESWVPCLIENENDCTALRACGHGRSAQIYCEEDGCRTTGTPFEVSCNGAIATLSNLYGSQTRDCSRAAAMCDPSSPTGCSDRQFTACPPGVSKADRCDGNVRLGCDGAGQVSYHDCERMGGVCGTTADGGQDCIYQEPADPLCTDPDFPTRTTCEATTLSVCVNGARIELSAPEVCPP